MVLQHIFLRYNGKKVPLTANKSIFETELYADCRLTQEQGGERLQINIHPKQPIDFQGIEVRYTYNYAPDSRVFCNGWQSWTESREFRPDEKIPPLLWGTSKFMGAMGDYNFYDYPNANGCLHSWSYSYIRNKKGTFWLASLNETTGFSLIEHDTNVGTITISTEKLELEHSYPALDMFMGFQNPFENTAYFSARLPKEAICWGWTSWYNHYTAIDEKIIQQAAKSFSNFKKQQNLVDILSDSPADTNVATAFGTTFVQIDDGWQAKIGDWLQVKSSFPKGMEAIADEIRSNGSSPGLWLAPFICESKSDIFKNKKEWLLQDAAGNPVVAGYN
ncbi:MAG: hypothetical protein RI894_1310, partial [Bacteroidota bacterium]